MVKTTNQSSFSSKTRDTPYHQWFPSRAQGPGCHILAQVDARSGWTSPKPRPSCGPWTSAEPDGREMGKTAPYNGNLAFFWLGNTRINRIPSGYVKIAIGNGPFIVDLPITVNMVIFHSYVNVYQRVIWHSRTFLRFLQFQTRSNGDFTCGNGFFLPSRIVGVGAPSILVVIGLLRCPCLLAKPFCLLIILSIIS